MVRKSRKFLKNNNLYSIGAYLRLSALDNKESDSIQNQKNIILDYIKNKKEFVLYKIYEDNYTGQTFDRANFKIMLEDIKKDKINCIIVKDLSRFGRNYKECGLYIEKIFPFLNIRFIAINDNYDSDNKEQDFLNFHFKNIANEMYAKDISKKVSSVLQNKKKEGLFIGSFAPYGYTKDKNQLFINKETCNNVKIIFNLRLKGYSYYKIACFLNKANILSKSAYLYKIGILKNSKFANIK